MDCSIRSDQLLNYASDDNYFIRSYLDFSCLAKSLFLAVRVLGPKSGLLGVIGIFSWWAENLFSMTGVLVSETKLGAFSIIPDYLFTLTFIQQECEINPLSKCWSTWVRCYFRQDLSLRFLIDQNSIRTFWLSIDVKSIITKTLVLEKKVESIQIRLICTILVDLEWIKNEKKLVSIDYI